MYTYKNATDTLLRYLNLEISEVKYIDNTHKRGLLYNNQIGETCVIFIYPISRKADNSKNFFDTRDSGAVDRCNAWNYAIVNNLKYFCLGVHDQFETYIDYIFSLECDEATIEAFSGTIKNGESDRRGSQIVIPSDYKPSKSFERIITRNKFRFAVIHKDKLQDYLVEFDNRPYLRSQEILDIPDLSDDFDTLQFNTGFQSDVSRNRIIFGAPGTGKSYKINEEIKQLLKDGGSYERVTFHPDYSYANFVGTYKPVPYIREDGERSITYEYVPGPFSRVLVEALKDGMSGESRAHILVVEEINRANMAAVFGDVFQLLDRGPDNVSEYPIHTSEDMKKYFVKELGGSTDNYNEIRLPDNMFIWATMNSADQGVFPMDTAFKRRWDFTYLGINKNEDKIKKAVLTLGTGSYARIVSWNDLRKAINDKLLEFKVNEDKLMGTFFISMSTLRTIPQDGGKRFKEAFKNKVIMYLFDDAAKRKSDQLFEGCSKSSLYSEIVREFDYKGVNIFCDSIKNQFTDEPNQIIGDDEI